VGTVAPVAQLFVQPIMVPETCLILNLERVNVVHVADLDGTFLDMHESVIECLRVHSAHDCSVIDSSNRTYSPSDLGNVL
jgi:hypothetical protein